MFTVLGERFLSCECSIILFDLVRLGGQMVTECFWVSWVCVSG